jgi:mRNA-degrading endonuclease RelE of RelBE toxin-antitoxin system
MPVSSQPYRIVWLDEAKTDMPRVDRPNAMRIFEVILRFARTGSGDVKTLHGDLAGAFRLRAGKYRVLFTFEDGAMQIFAVDNLSEAYL